MANDYLKKFAPVATHLSSPTSATKSAISGLMHRSKQRRYSITSSAVASSVGGTASWNALAVFRLITN